MGYGDDLNFTGEFAKDDRKRITFKQRPPSPMKIWREEIRMLVQFVDGTVEFFVKAICCL